MEQPIPLNIQEIIQATVDRAIATLLESGLLKEKRGRKHHSRSRSPHKGKKDKKKHKKRSCSSSSSSSSSGEEEGKKKKDKKHKDRKGCAERQSRSRSHSRSRSRSKHHHFHKLRHHSDPPVSHHHFHYPPCWMAENSSEEPCQKSHDGKRKKRSRKLHCMKFYYKHGPATSDENEEQEKDCELRKNFENLEVGNNPSAPTE